ncbi:MAG: universal stress protein [Vicinamibacteria bacterium]|nr:universal stress protein [Vicinamibacteria bacterium]
MIASTRGGLNSKPWAPSSPRRILCATELGPGSDRVILEADAWARRHAASLEFVYAVAEASSTHVLFPEIAHRAMASFPTFARRATKIISERVEELTSRPRADVNVEVHIGSPAAIIVEIAEEMEADLVVIGPTGAEETEGRLGSVARRVIQHSHGPVLLVRGGAQNDGPVLVATALSGPGMTGAHARPEQEDKSQ